MIERNERPSDRRNRHSRRTGSTHRWCVGKRLRRHVRRARYSTGPVNANRSFFQLQ